MALSKAFLRRLQEEESEPEDEPTETREKPASVWLMIRVYSPDTLYMTDVPRPYADRVVAQGHAEWVNEDAIKMLMWTDGLVKGPGLTPEQKRRRAVAKNRR